MKKHKALLTLLINKIYAVANYSLGNALSLHPNS